MGSLGHMQVLWRRCQGLKGGFENRLRFTLLARGLHTSAVTIKHSHPNIAQILDIAPQELPQQLTVVGFVRTVRNQKRFSFVELGDGSTPHSLQAVLEPSLAQGYVSALEAL